MSMVFEDLEAWRQSRKVVRRIYDLTREEPLKRDYGLCNQIQRSAVSMMTNIAEGFERVGTREKLNFYTIARASAGETRSLLNVIEDNYSDLAPLCEQLRNETKTTGRKITGLITSFRKRQAFTTISILILISLAGFLIHIFA